jgi:hypothetical protein
MMTLQPSVSHPSSRAAPEEQSEWLHVPCGGWFPDVGGGCAPAHWPFEQVSSVLQARPQPPQLFGSLVTSTQSEPHNVCVHVLGGGWFDPLSWSDDGFVDAPLSCAPASPFFATMLSPAVVPTAHAAALNAIPMMMEDRMAVGLVARSRTWFNALP